MSEASSGKPAATQSCETPAPAGAKTRAPPDDSRRLERLLPTIEGEIIPRLLMSFCGPSTMVGDNPDADAVVALARLVLMRESVAAADIVRAIDRNCLRLIAPAARRLGEIWERNECDFDQLVMGLGRLESVIRKVNEHSPRPGR